MGNKQATIRQIGTFVQLIMADRTIKFDSLHSTFLYASKNGITITNVAVLSEFFQKEYVRICGPISPLITG